MTKFAAYVSLLKTAIKFSKTMILVCFVANFFISQFLSALPPSVKTDCSTTNIKPVPQR